MAKLRVGLVGCGFMGRMHGNVYGMLEGADLVAAADRNPERLSRYAQEMGCEAEPSLEALLSREDIDAIDICLPTYLHREATVAAARAGKHVVCEKPMALNAADAEAMIEAAREAGVRLMIAHCIRFWPEYALLKQIVDDQRYGRLLSINLTRYGEFPSWSSENWLADESKAGGGVLDMHIHDTDFVLYLLGEPEAMSSWGTVDERGPSHVFTTMRYPGCVAHLEGGWNLPPKTPFKMAFRAIFEQGAAIMDGGPMTIYPADGEPFSPEFEQMEASGGGNVSSLGGYYHELRDFVEKVLTGRPFEISTPESSLLSLRTTLGEIEQIKANA